ncbi:MAG: alpha/beta fold hydrolase [bacterium]
MDTIINGTKIHWIERGDPQGLPVVFLHGFPFSHEMWLPQLAALPPGIRALAYDLRGLGRSEAGDWPLTLEGHVDDLIAFLDDRAIAQAVLVGLSMGGYIALRALQRNPERCAAAALCDTRSEADTDEAKLRRAAQIKQIREAGVEAFAEGFLKAIFAPQSFAGRPEAVAAIRRIILETEPRAMAATLLALAARSDTSEALSRLRIPVLLLVGELDQITPPAAAQAMHEKIPGSRLEVLPEAAHMSNLENPEAFNRCLWEFLRLVPRR